MTDPIKGRIHTASDARQNTLISLNGEVVLIDQKSAVDLAQDILAMTDVATDRCVTCHWWGRGGGSVSEANRQCRRFPPITTWDGEELSTKWPWTNRDDWCGEFRTIVVIKA